MKKLFTLFFISCFWAKGLFLIAQAPFAFTNANSKFASATFHSGNALSVVDMDGDGMDDIARLSQGNDLYYTIQRTGQTFNNIHAVATGLGAAWAMVVGDVDSNGRRDVVVGSGNAARLIKAYTALDSFTLSSNLPAPGTFFPQNMNFADIDNDGLIDLFICNDDAAGVTWKNVSGAYPVVTNFFSLSNPGTDNSGNYGSIWADINNDGHLDFYIAHCRQGTPPSDARRLDQLFVNDGNNNYVLDGGAAPGVRGLRNYAMTWTASFEDIDNDGDLDCLLTETDVASQLFLNNGNGFFTEITNGSGISVNVIPYQSKMEDLDNDGFVDIIISGGDVRVFHNNHNNKFALDSGLFNSDKMLSFATGDLNHDGKIDLYSSYGTGYNTPSSTDDVLWMNTTSNNNHFITFNLQGKQSNRDALGARVEIYGAWGKQIREVRAGESYGTTNSFMCHFGLGTATVVDSAIIRWPKGLVSHLYNRAVDQFITVIEGQCSSPDNIITFDGPSVLCAGQSVTMTVDSGYSYLWNTGATTQSISTSVLGDFTVKLIDTISECSSISKMATILSQPNQTPTITAAGPVRFCEGESVILQTASAASYLWSTGDTTQSIAVAQPGLYSVTIQGVCAAFASSPISILVDTSHVSNAVSVSVCENNATPVILQAGVTGSAYWYYSPTGGNLVGSGDSYTTPAMNGVVTYYVESHDSVFGLGGEVGPVSNAIGNGGNLTGFSLAQIFDVFKPLLLKTVVVYASTTKPRIIELRNASNILLQSDTINIAQGTQTLNLNFSIPIGTGYRLGWAGNAPDLYRNTSGVNYPYTIPNLISITGNTLPDPTRWYAYYNWQVEEQPITCTSVRVPVVAAVNPVPVASITADGATSFCSGASVTLSTDSATSYLWSNDSTLPSITVDQSGNYSVVITDVNGCSASSLPITITVNENPILSINGLNGHYFNTDGIVNLTGSPTGGNFSGTAVNGNTFDPSIAGIGGPYTITYNYTDSNGCSASVSADVTVELNSSVYQIAGISAVHIFPNPNEGDFLLSMRSEGIKKIDMEISNYLGERVFQERNITLDHTLAKQISIKNLSKGFYNLSIFEGKKQNTYKLIVIGN